MSALSVDVSNRENATVVRIAGRAGGPEAEHLEEQLAAVMALRPKRLVLDLAALEFMSSMGVSALLRVHRLAKDAGSDLRIAAARPTLVALLRAVKLDGVVPMHETVESALCA